MLTYLQPPVRADAALWLIVWGRSGDGDIKFLNVA